MSEQEAMDNILELIDEDGNAVQFEHLCTFEYGESFYVGLLPVEPLEDMEDGEVLIMRVVEEGDEDTFFPVETEEELEGAWNAFMEAYYDEEEDGEEHAEGCDCDNCTGC